MLSRTAASLYWLGRYVERADFVARLVEATVRLDALSARPAGRQPGQARWRFPKRTRLLPKRARRSPSRMSRGF